MTKRALKYCLEGNTRIHPPMKRRYTAPSRPVWLLIVYGKAMLMAGILLLFFTPFPGLWNFHP